MKTEMIETGDLSSQITITIEPSDYKSEYDKGLKKYRKEAHLKGFRKGKTPLSAIRKMYGKGVLADVINDKLQKTLADYITDNKIDILGNPIPSEDQQFVDFETKQLETLEFKFDLGLSPQIEVQGVEATDTYVSYEVAFGEDRIDEEIEQLQKRGGVQEEIEAPIEALDMVTLSITESSVEERDAWSGEITIMPERLTEDSQAMVIGKKNGDTLSFDIYELEKDTTEDYVKKYFLKDAPDYVGRNFDAVVKTIKRLVPAEINEEFFEKMFDPKDEIKDIEGARALIKKDLESFYVNQGKAITQRKILESLIEKNMTALPDEFLKRWLMSSNENLSPEQLEGEYEGFTKNLIWTLVKQHYQSNSRLRSHQKRSRKVLLRMSRSKLVRWAME